MGSNDRKVETTQQTREWARAEYQAKTKGLNFTKDFYTRQEALMHDPMATVGERVMAWFLRRSWGEFVLYPIRDDGEWAYQRDCARDLKIDKRRVADAVSYFKARGYLASEGKLVYPVISPVLASPPPKEKKSGEYRTFLEHWKVAHSADFLELEVARSTVKRLTKVLLSEYKKSRRQGQSAGASLCIESKKIKEESESSSSAVVISPPIVEKEEEEEAPSANQPSKPPDLYQQFKNEYPEHRFNEGDAKPIFLALKPAEQKRALARLRDPYLKCERWKDERGQYIKWAAGFLTNYYFDADPPPPLRKHTPAPPAKQGFAESVKQEFQRRVNTSGRI